MAIFVFHPDYYADIGPHVLQVEKFRKTYERLIAAGAAEDAFVRPEEATLDPVRHQPFAGLQPEVGQNHRVNVTGFDGGAGRWDGGRHGSLQVSVIETHAVTDP